MWALQKMNNLFGTYSSKDGIETDPKKIQAIVNCPDWQLWLMYAVFRDLPITTEDLYINMSTVLDLWMY